MQIVRRISEPLAIVIKHRMPHYLYTFIEMFGMIGRGTPDDPGSDYGLVCLIEAPDENQARQWALKVHGDFEIARWMFTDSPSEGRLYREGEIERVDDVVEFVKINDCAICRLGELPNWIEPWRGCEARGTRPATAHWQPPTSG